MSDKSVCAYMAGLMDGEGHITTTRSRYKEGAIRKRKYGGLACRQYHFTLNIGLTSTDKRLIDWIEQHFGGIHYTDKRQQQNWKRAFRWRLLGQNAQEHFLLGILPYLILKKTQACFALEFIRMRGREDQAARQFFHDRFMELNRRGVSPETNTPAISQEMKIESGLYSNIQSGTVVIQ